VFAGDIPNVGSGQDNGSSNHASTAQPSLKVSDFAERLPMNFEITVH
jgi:hypothetical protein